MTRYEVKLIERQNSDFTVKSINKIESDDLIHLMSQFTLMILMIQRDGYLNEIKCIRMENDDIPF